jgi:hypothetical protein
MGKTDLEQLVLQLDAQYSKFQNAMLKAQGISNQSAGKIERRFKEMNSSVSTSLSVFKSFGAGLIGGLGVEQLAKAAASAIKSIADIGDAATKLGLTTDEFQTNSFAAQLAGTDVDAFSSAMKKLALNTSDAQRGQGEFGDILKANNVSITDANGKLLSQTQILGVVADLVANAANEQDGMAIAQTALGKSGIELMGLLVQGAKGVEAANKSAKDSAIKFTAEQIAKAQEYDDKIDTLIEKISVGLKGTFIDLAPEIENTINNTIREFQTLQSVIDGVISTTKSIAVPALTQGTDPANIPRLDLGFGASVPNPNYRQPVVQPNPRGSIPSYTQPRDPLYKSGTVGPFAPKAPVTILPAKPLAALRDTAGLEAARKANAEWERLQRESDARSRQLERDRVEATRQAEQDRMDTWQRSYDFEFAKVQESQQNYMEAETAKRDSLMALAEMGYSAFEGFVTGSLKAKDAVKQLALQIAQAVAQAALFGQGPLSGLLGGGKSGGLFGSLIGGLLGGGAKSPVSLYHDGGIVGQSSGMSRSVNPGIFANAPRYHNGGVAGLKPNEVPAILQRGERVIPNGMASGGQGGTAINLTQHFHGVAGNSEIRRIANEATSAGIRDYASKAPEIDLERRLRA